MPEQMAFNLTETARLLGLDRKTVTALVHREELPAFRVGSRYLVSRSALEQWLKDSAVCRAEYGGVRS